MTTTPIDWTRSDRQLSAELGVSRKKIRKMRLEAGASEAYRPRRWSEVDPALWALSNREIARRLGVHPKTVLQARRRHAPAAPQAVVPEHHVVKGVSSYVDAKGELKGQWIKTDLRRQSLLDALKQIGDELEGPGPTPRPAPGPENSLVVVPWGDPHFGMLSWAPETGQTWDLETAERTHYEETVSLLDRAPSASRALVVAIGDTLHANGRVPMTPASGHVLDVDSRWTKAYHVTVRTIRRTVDAALERYPDVDVIILSGNHDPDAAYALSYTLHAWYRQEPRVRVDMRVSHRRSYVWGSCLLGFAHGDKRRMHDLGGVMAGEWGPLWGRTRWHAWYTGHVHHDASTTLADGADAESLASLCARDAYTTGGGWSSVRRVRLDVWDRRMGRVQRLWTTLPHHCTAELEDAPQMVGWAAD